MTSREIKRAGWGVIRKEQCMCKANDEAVASGGPFFGGILRGIGVGASRKEQQAAAAAGTRGPKKKKIQRKKDNKTTVPTLMLLSLAHFFIRVVKLKLVFTYQLNFGC